MTLYRIHRPRFFSDIYGQESAVLTFQQALEHKRVAHAYLVSGPRGTGKTSSARIFARAATCLNPQSGSQPGKKSKTKGFEPCNQCLACLSILNNQTTDIIEIDAASNRGIEDIRELREQAKYPPLQLTRKIYIIDEVHMLTGEAFNALLKTLEEPPEHCLFILATTELHKVPSTIRSRCQLIRFERGSLAAITQKLDKIIAQEGFSVEKGISSLLAKHAEGGFRDAETLLENLTTQYQELTLEQARQALGILAEEKIEEILRASLNQDTGKAMACLQEILPQLSLSPERITGQMINRLRNAMYAQEDWISGQPAAFALEKLLEAYILQKSAPVPTLPLEIAILEIAGRNLHEANYLDRQSSVKNKDISPLNSPVLIQKETSKNTSTVKVIPDTVPLSTPQIPVIELSQDLISDPRQAWKIMVATVCKENLFVGQALKDAVFHKAENGQIILYVRFKFHADKLNEKKISARVSQLMHDLTGQVWHIIYEVNSLAPKPRQEKALGPGLEVATKVFSSEDKRKDIK